MTLLHSPVYDEIRRAHSKPFTPISVAELEDFSRSACCRMLDELLPKRKFDLFLDYSGMLSADGASSPRSRTKLAQRILFAPTSRTKATRKPWSNSR
jgi:hypothetical protein